MRVLLLLAVVTTGCLNGGTDCLGESPDLFFDPDLGACLYIGSAEGCQCVAGPPHSDCVVGDPHDRDLAACYACGSVTEQDCIARRGCIAQYVGSAFSACRGAPPSGSSQVGACAGLDARACSRRDYCALHYKLVDEQVPMFEACTDEVAASHLASEDAVDPDQVFPR